MPSVGARRAVQVAGALLAAVGVLLIADSRLPAWIRLPAGLAWLLDVAMALARQRQGAVRLARLGLRGDGHAVATGPGGAACRVELLPGSVHLRQAAWLRIRWPDGLVHGELLPARRQPAHAWRRLAVILRLWR